ncbi:MAG: class I SAM-dependent RNA methyltransferase [Clostridia bacterium]
MKKFSMVIPCLFGLEGIIKDELIAMGAANVVAHDGKVECTGDIEILARINIRLRCGERVLIKIAEFKATTFDELFENVKAIDFGEYIAKTDEFPIKGYSLKSVLFSVPDCQAIIKKAMATSLSGTYDVMWLPETGVKKQIQFSIFKDVVTLMIDTSGQGLHKRGYRAISNIAPLRETLAAAIITLSKYKAGETLYDPFCGSGTIPIEAAMIAKKMAPGLLREFAAEKFGEDFKNAFIKEKQIAKSKICESDNEIFASDIDVEAVKLTIDNAKKAGVSDMITARRVDVRDFTLEDNKNSLVICNPPYGERLMEQKEAEKLYSDMGHIFRNLPKLRAYILTSHEDFEGIYGKKCDKNRKLYNGMIKCHLFQYFG